MGNEVEVKWKHNEEIMAYSVLEKVILQAALSSSKFLKFKRLFCRFQ